MGAVTDILLPAAAGVGQGFTQGIKDYANIQGIKKEEEMFPIQKGIAQSTLNRAQREEAEYKKQQEDLDSPLDYRTLPQYQAANEENRKIFDTFMTGRPMTKRGVGMAFQQAQSTSQGFKAISDTGLDIHAGEVTKAQEAYNAAVEKYSKIKQTLTAPMGQGVKGGSGFEYENPEAAKAKEEIAVAEQGLHKLQADHDVLEKNVNKGKAKVAINEMYMSNKDLIDKNQSIKMMVDMTREIGDTADVAKLIDIIAKAKDPKVANEVELFLSTHQYGTPKETWDAWEQYKKSIKETPTYVNHFGNGGAAAADKAPTHKDAFGRAVKWNQETKKYVYVYNGKEIPQGLVIKEGEKKSSREMSKLRRDSIAVGIKPIEEEKKTTNKVYNPATGEFE